jgi:PAS domain-containing protein
MRVCSSCGLGLLLETRIDLVPSPADAFIVVDSQLAIEAVSAQAERVLAVSEQDVVHLPLHSLIGPAGIDSAGEYGLTAAVMEAAAGGDQLSSVFVRPRNTFGVRVRARICACGPPRAALIVLDAERPPLRAV